MARSMILYRIIRPIVAVLSRLYWRLTIEGTEHVPETGAFVLSPVHRSFIDFALVSGVTKRRLRYMGKDALWKVSLFGKLLSSLGAFPVHRGSADREALRRSIEVVEAGEPLVLFPEGTRRFGPEVQKLFDGAAYVATRAGVPIVPVGIGGSERAMQKGKKIPRPVKIHIVVGKPLYPSAGERGRTSRRAVRELTEQLHTELQRLFDEAQDKAGVARAAA
jgi:1-acyl-sn-glycerol-3-phosphate acyltransferase